ncbi:MAG: TetR/AcrR family transcriptional regulator [Bdellovibrionales bacterium]|nr:TetR/AcrR family transcriptional regulator [Bdellovibrionales bacterium]
MTRVSKKNAKKSDSYHHGNLADACIRTGLEFLAKGRSDFSFRELARALKVSPGAPYKHFETKEVLLAAIAEQGFVIFTEALAESKEISKDKGPHEKFHAMGEAYLNFAVNNPDHYRLMFTDAIPDHDLYPSLKQNSMQSFQQLTSMVEEMQDIGFFKNQDPIEQSMLIWAHVHGLSSLIIEGRIGFVLEQTGGDVQQLKAGMSEKFLAGILA